MKTGQLYRLDMTADNIKNSEPGQVVYLGDDSDEIIGFLESIDGTTMDLCLFQQSPNIVDNAIIIEEKLSPEDVGVLLRRTLAGASKQIQDSWA